MDVFIVGSLMFIVTVFVSESVLYAIRTWRYPDRHKVQKRLKAIESFEYNKEGSDILRTRTLSEVAIVDRMLQKLPCVYKFDKVLQQADVRSPIGLFLLLILVLFSVVLWGSTFFTNNLLSSIFIALLAGGMPIFYVRIKKKKRMDKFERQFPETLDAIARALRAGHAFTSGMKLAADECEDPIASEFCETLDEINYGTSVSDALKNLVHRVGCPDLKYFAVSVIIQQETGGNLAEITENIAYIIRERFRFRGKVKSLSAEGKISAIILIALPFIIVVALTFLNPDYIRILFEEKIGRYVAALGMFNMIIGALLMKKMTKIDV